MIVISDRNEEVALFRNELILKIPESEHRLAYLKAHRSYLACLKSYLLKGDKLLHGSNSRGNEVAKIELNYE